MFIYIVNTSEIQSFGFKFLKVTPKYYNFFSKNCVILKKLSNIMDKTLYLRSQQVQFS